LTAPEPRVDRLPDPLATIAATAGAPGLELRDHGPRHWKCVALTGLQLAIRDPAIDLLAVFSFAQLHDCQRVGEYGDPGHGPRAAEITRTAIAAGQVPGFEPSSERAHKLVHAIHDHTTAAATDDPTVGACWDADRLNLWRVGTQPSIEYMSTTPAREHFDELSEHAKELIEGSEPTWEQVTSAIFPAV
jgi:uncharacterized protein